MPKSDLSLKGKQVLNKRKHISKYIYDKNFGKFNSKALVTNKY